MSKYIVIEMQNGAINTNTWVYEDRASAEVKFYAALAEIVKSPIAVHTIMLVTDSGFVLDCKCYTHEQPAEEPAPEE